MKRYKVSWGMLDLPLNATYIGRPTKYGNPYKIGVDGNREEVVAKYEIWLQNKLREDPKFLEDLKGHDIACWCKPEELCHGDIIIKYCTGQH